VGTVFDAYCPAHGGRVVLGPDSVVAFGGTGHGVVVRWTCACGGTGSAPFEVVSAGRWRGASRALPPFGRR
jgi:hypothetical protein